MVSFSEGESRGRRFRLSYLAYARARETRARTQCRQSHARCPLTLPLALPLSHPMVCFAQILKSPDTRPGLTNRRLNYFRKSLKKSKNFLAKLQRVQIKATKTKTLKTCIKLLRYSIHQVVKISTNIIVILQR